MTDQAPRSAEAWSASDSAPLARQAAWIGGSALAAIAVHLAMRYGAHVDRMWETSWGEIAWVDVPLIVALVAGGAPLVWQLVRRAWALDFGADLLAGISIVTAAILGEYLAGVLVVLMLSGGEVLEGYAVRSASGVLAALARRMPLVAHRKVGAEVRDIAVAEIGVGDLLVVFPHEVCPVDGTVVEGRGTMDESYLTGEPFQIAKAPGSNVLSGAVNGEAALVVRTARPMGDSRYAQIMRVMRESEQRRPRLRRLGDQLGALYTPLALLLALAAWLASGEAMRFLAVLVVATPCPLLIGIPVAIIGSISLSARRGIVIRDPAILERLDTCQTAIFDKTGTLTQGKPQLDEVLPAPTFGEPQLVQWAASLEQYSKHPLAAPLVDAAGQRNIDLLEAGSVTESPGTGLSGEIAGRTIEITSRAKWLAKHPQDAPLLPGLAAGLECVMAVDGQYAATMRFRDRPRAEGARFIRHLGPNHHFSRLLLVSGDRASEVEYLAAQVGIKEVYASQSPEQKLEIARTETARAPALFLGDGINDAPAMTAATVGIAMGQNSDVTAEAAGAVIMESSLTKVDELLHISQRMRRIALQSAVGGMVLSLGGMVLAAAGYLPPVAGALAQEAIDVLSVLNALRAAWVPGHLTDLAPPTAQTGVGGAKSTSPRPLA